MGAQLSKGGVAVEGKAAADPAAAKANGQVSKAGPACQRGATWHPTPTGSMGAAAGRRWGGSCCSFMSGFSRRYQGTDSNRIYL